MKKEIDSRNLESLFNSALKNQLDKKLDSAEEEYLQCLSLDYKVFDTLRNLGYLYQEKKRDEAETVYLKI